MKVYNKLVRDLIPGIIAKQGKRVTYRAVYGEEFKKALKDKLLEEVNELLAAETEDQVIEELADVYEVLQTYRQTFTCASKEEVNSKKYEKGSEKGFFVWQYFLESVED